MTPNAPPPPPALPALALSRRARHLLARFEGTQAGSGSRISTALSVDDHLITLVLHSIITDRPYPPPPQPHTRHDADRREPHRRPDQAWRRHAYACSNHHTPLPLSDGKVGIFLFTPSIPNYPKAKFPGVVVFSEIYQGRSVLSSTNPYFRLKTCRPKRLASSWCLRLRYIQAHSPAHAQQ